MGPGLALGCQPSLSQGVLVLVAHIMLGLMLGSGRVHMIAIRCYIGLFWAFFFLQRKSESQQPIKIKAVKMLTPF